MGIRNFLLVAMIVLSGGFANGFLSISFSSNSGQFVQWVFADNTINNQTSTSNINCDSTSSCITNPSQSSVIGGGDENKIDQLIDLQNNHCTGSSICDLTGNEQASISQSNEGEIFDDGTGNVNTQTSHSDADSNNVNVISQQESQLNKLCDGKSECTGETDAQVFVGIRRGGPIFSLGNDSKNTQSTLTFRSNNDNSLSQIESQNIHSCPGTICSNIISDIGTVGSALQGTIFDFGVNNTNLQDIIVKDSSSKNIMKSTAIQETDQCVTTLDSTHQCSNNSRHAYSLGGTSSGLSFSSGNNNTNSIKVLTSGSSSSNRVFDTSKQQNKDCIDIQCTNSVSNAISIGRNVAGSLNSAGTNNTDSQDSNQIDSGNNNKVSGQSSQQNIHCKTNGSCDNFGGSSWLIGLVSGGDIFSDGSNNIHKLTAVQNSSGNTNTASSSGAQENKNCQENTGCVNFLSTGGLIGLLSNGFVETSGNNNSIEDPVNSIESSNDNNIKETADQENNYCTDSSFCFNLLGVTSDIGVISGGGITNSGDNNSISNSLDIANSDNNNKIAQDGEQSNEHCSESSSCLNFGAVSADIGSLQGSDISNDESNAKIVESTSEKDTNNGNVISQKLDQNNQCREGSSCSNDGNLLADISGQNNQRVDQSMTQKNLCLKQSTCNSTGSVTGGSGSNTQSNLCVKNSECSNSGTNNKNICLDGSSCTNTGINTKVISKDSSCSSGVEGSTTICSNGRIISVGNNPEKNP